MPLQFSVYQDTRLLGELLLQYICTMYTALEMKSLSFNVHIMEMEFMTVESMMRLQLSVIMKLIVKMEKCVWQVEMPQKEEWKFVSVVYGELCVIPTGISTMLKLFAVTLDCQVHFQRHLSVFHTHMAKEKGQFFYQICSAMEMKDH
jgi:hypothetical protein